MSRLGIMIYGRSSRELESFVKDNLASHCELEIRGALDGCSDEQVTAIQAADASKGVPEFLADGSIVFVDHEEVTQRVKLLADEFKTEGIERSLICCTAPWPGLEADSDIFIPSKMLEHVALSLLPTGGTLAVIQPVEETKDEEIKHWQALGVTIIRKTFSPEQGNDEELQAVAEALVQEGADVIALDCLSFVDHHKQIVLSATEKPTLLPMSLIGKVIDEAIL